MIRAIEHVGIYSKDTDALAKWYVDVLNFEVVESKNGNYFIRLPEGDMLEICVATSDGSSFEMATEGIRHIAFTVTLDEFDAVVTNLMNHNVKVLKEPATTSTGGRTFFFTDIEGNVLHLIARKEKL